MGSALHSPALPSPFTCLHCGRCCICCQHPHCMPASSPAPRCLPFVQFHAVCLSHPVPLSRPPSQCLRCPRFISPPPNNLTFGLFNKLLLCSTPGVCLYIGSICICPVTTSVLPYRHRKLLELWVQINSVTSLGKTKW